MKNFTSKLPPYIALLVMLISLCLVMCVPADNPVDPVERDYNEGRQSNEEKQSEEKQSDEKQSDEKQSDEKEVIINTLNNTGTDISTTIYEADGYRYRIFWMGNGSEEASLVVINLDEQEARIDYYRANQ